MSAVWCTAVSPGGAPAGGPEVARVRPGSDGNDAELATGLEISVPLFVQKMAFAKSVAGTDVVASPTTLGTSGR